MQRVGGPGRFAIVRCFYLAAANFYIHPLLLQYSTELRSTKKSQRLLCLENRTTCLGFAVNGYNGQALRPARTGDGGSAAKHANRVNPIK